VVVHPPLPPLVAIAYAMPVCQAMRLVEKACLTFPPLARPQGVLHGGGLGLNKDVIQTVIQAAIPHLDARLNRLRLVPIAVVEAKVDQNLSNAFILPALHCTALQCRAHCTLHCNAMHCGSVHCTALHCSALR
jgi:hypothetical protein